jgi:hypothetical protein
MRCGYTPDGPFRREVSDAICAPLRPPSYNDPRVKTELSWPFIWKPFPDAFRRRRGLALAGMDMLTYRYTNEEDGKTLRRYWTSACQTCALKDQCTPGKERRISPWEHEAVLETVRDRLDRNPDKMRVRRQTVEYPFGAIKAWMGATQFQMRRLPKVASEMALHMLAYDMKRVMQVLGVCALMPAMRA